MVGLKNHLNITLLDVKVMNSGRLSSGEGAVSGGGAGSGGH
jgi:hypothetical protein